MVAPTASNTPRSIYSQLMAQSVVALARPLYETNIGATSRAMGNMGFSNLAIIAPQCEIGYPAQQAAATGQFALQNRQTFDSVAAMIKEFPQHIRISFSARDGRGRESRVLEEVLQRVQDMPDVYTESHGFIFLFGPEDAGLTADDVDQCHFCARIPTFGDKSSLNLAQAVLLALFLTRQKFGGELTPVDGSVHWQRRDKQEMKFPFPEALLKEWLLAQGFHLGDRSYNAFTVLRRMLLRSVPLPKEIELLHVALTQSIRKIKGK